MNYAEIRRLDTANGPGICATIFFSGCHFNCQGCFNKEVQDFAYGNKFDTNHENQFIQYAKNPIVKNICILGGEPLHQDLAELKRFIIRVRVETGKPIWLWTGYTWEQICDSFKLFDVVRNVDILVDGKFQIGKKDLQLAHRGSSNQNIIDVSRSIISGKKVLNIT